MTNAQSSHQEPIIRQIAFLVHMQRNMRARGRTGTRLSLAQKAVPSQTKLGALAPGVDRLHGAAEDQP